MTRKPPKTLAEAIVQIEQWERSFDTLAAANARAQQENASNEERHAVELAAATKRRQEAEKNRDAMAASITETKNQFDDLKQRVHDLEIENATMVGYLNRVQEDDEVREELIAVGDPDGEQTLLPKRKPHLNRMYSSGPLPVPYAQAEPFSYNNDYDRPKPKPKHWVNY